MSRRVVAILNPSAGKDEPVLSTLSDVLGAADLEWEARVTTGPEDAGRFALEAHEEGADLVLAYGGDGTVSAVATPLAGTSTPLGILPGGTGNSVAQELGIPLDLRAALEFTIDPGSPIQPIDCLRMGEQRFLLRVGVGADARMVFEAPREAKDRLGWLAYLLSALEQIRQPVRARYQLVLDGTELEVEALTVILANVGRVGRGGMRLAEDVDPADGFLDVFAIRDADAASVLAVGATMLGISAPPEWNALEEQAPLCRWRVKRASVVAEPDQEVHGDGEVLGTTPIEVELEASKIRVVRPILEAGPRA